MGNKLKTNQVATIGHYGGSTLLDVTYTLNINDDSTQEMLLTKTGHVSMKDYQEFAVRVTKGITAGSCTL